MQNKGVNIEDEEFVSGCFGVSRRCLEKVAGLQQIFCSQSH